MLGLPVDFATADDGASCCFKKLSDTVGVKVIDHFALEIGSILVIAIEDLEVGLTLYNEVLQLAFVYEDVVGRDADLARVERLSESDLGAGEINRGRSVNNEGALTTELQDAWNQIFGSVLSDDFTDCGGASEAEQVYL